MRDVGQLRTFKDGTAIITGGASGIGRALGKALASRGCTVILADIQLEMAEKAAKEINCSGGSASAVKLDVTDSEAVKTVVQETFDTCGRLDYMFNNAGIAINGRFYDFELTDWHRCIDINLVGVVHGVHSAYSIMEKQGFGHIVNTASIAGLVPWPTTFAYAATKHAVVGLTTLLSAELAGSGIHASVLCPGTVQTAIMEEGARSERWAGVYSEEKLKKFFAQTQGMDPDIFVEKALRQIVQKKPVIVIPLGYKIVWWINRLSPALGISLSHQIYKVILKKIGASKRVA
jgi:NAD(P)-dependent dehydrogenase (short-subunit alcohol dehydrogenase family)